MIKGLKKLCILGLIGLPILLANFSNAGLQEFDLGYTEEITANTSLGYSLELKNGANFLLNDTYKLVQFKGSGQYPRQITYFWNGSGMYLIVGRPYRNPADIKVQGFLQYVNIVQYSDINMSYGVSPGFTPIEDFISNPQYSNPDKLLFGGYEDSQNQSLCFVYSSLDEAVCFAYNDSIDCGGQPQYCSDGVNKYITNSLSLSSRDLSYLAPFTTDSPFVGGSVIDTTPILYEITTGDVVRYYEESRNFDESMCYVGTTDMTSLYEDRIPYDQGSGYTIFDTYSKLYDKSSYKLSEIAEFYSVWIDNFSNWFRGGDTHVIYTYGELPTYGNDLTNPFLNNLAVYYFIGSTFWYSHQTHYNTNGVGMSLSYYCYNKLTNVSNDGSTYNIIDDHGSNIDGEVLDKKNNVNHYYSGEYEIVAQSRDGTPVDYFSSGSNYTNAKDFFDANFNKFKEVLRPLSPGDLGLGYVPGYIILFMLALILFRFLGH